MTNKYFEYVNDSDPFDDEIEVYRGVDENLPADRGKVSCYLLTLLQLSPMILLDWLAESESHFLGQINVIIWPINNFVHNLILFTIR